MRVRARRFRLKRFLVYGFLCYMGLILVLQEINGFRLARELAALRRQVRAAHEQNQALYQRIADMKTDAYVEQVAREQLGLTRAGEVPFLPIDGGSRPAGGR